MPDSISSNQALLGALNNLNQSNQRLGINTARIASGERINSAKDDPAGLNINTRIETTIGALNQSVRNLNDGVSFVQASEASLANISENVQRARELAIQAANGTLDPLSRRALQAESEALLADTENVVANADFNGQSLLQGGEPLSFAVANGDISVKPASLAETVQSLRNTDLSTRQGASQALAVFDQALQTVNTTRAEFGAAQSRFASAVDNFAVSAEQQAAASSRISDADIAKESSALIRNRILNQAGLAVVAQANASDQQTIKALL